MLSIGLRGHMVVGFRLNLPEPPLICFIGPRHRLASNSNNGQQTITTGLRGRTPTDKACAAAF